MNNKETGDEGAIVDEIIGTLDELTKYLENEIKIEEALARQTGKTGTEKPPHKTGHLKLVK